MSKLNPKQNTLLIAAVLLGFLVLLGLNMSSEGVLQDPGEIDLNSSELIGYWSFDAEDRNSTHVFDLSTNGNDGIIHGTEFVEGIGGEAAYFDGLGDYIEIPDPNNILSGMGQLTIAFQINLSNKTLPQTYISKNNVWGPYSFRTYGGTTEIRPFIRNVSLEYSPGPQFVTILKDEFILYVFTYNGTTCSQYINGLFVRSDQCVRGGIWSSPGSLFIGKNNSGGDFYDYFKGTIDELVIFNKSLSNEEIEQIFGQFGCGDGVCGKLENSFVCYEDCFDQLSAGKFSTTQDYTIWYSDSTQKILPAFLAPENQVSEVVLNLAKNEDRTIQIALTSNIQAEIPISISPNSELITNIYTEETVPIITPSDHIPHFRGEIYDPLTKKNSLSLDEDRTSVILIEVKTNTTTPAGDHEISVVVGEETIPIKVHVYEFILPEKLTLETALDSGHFRTQYEEVPDCEATSVFEFHGLPDETGYATAEELAVVDAYFEDYAENKIVPYSPHIYRGVEYNCITRAFDFAKMDAALDYYLNNLSMNAAMIFHYGGWHYENGYPLCGYNITQAAYYEIASAYYQNITKHLDEKGWLNRSYIMIDEPHGIHLYYTKELATILTKNITPPLQIGPALNDHAAFAILNNSVNLWIIQNNEATSLPFFTPERGNALLRQGDEVWWYYTKSKVFDIDSPALDNTLNYWAAWKYNVTGILNWGGLIYDTHCGGDEGSRDMDNPWHNPRSGWGNGQITFYYPPCVEACTEPTYEIVPSLRVKLYREGIQDYEYFEILEKKISEAKHLGINTIGAESTLSRINALIISPTSWTNDPSLINEIRKDIATQIEFLQHEISCGQGGCQSPQQPGDGGDGDNGDSGPENNEDNNASTGNTSLDYDPLDDLPDAENETERDFDQLFYDTFNGKGYFVAGSLIGAIVILVIIFFVLSKKKQAQIS